MQMRYRGGNGPRAGHKLGYMPQIYCSRTCSNYARKSEGYVDRHGYRVVARNPKQIYQHTIVMEQMIGREMLPGETVHHKNGDRADNRPENLELWSSRHGKGQRVEDRIRDAESFLAEHGLRGGAEYGDPYILALIGG